jgi:hypothetical protein
MNVNEGVMTKIMADAMKESGLPADKIEEITSYMVTYINTGSKYGHTPQGFLKWYTKDQGGTIK